MKAKKHLRKNILDKSDKKIWREIRNALTKAATILLVAHVDPDGDTLGSMLALGQICKKLKKKVFYYCEDVIPQVYRFLPEINQIKNDLTAESYFDLLFATDASDLSRLGKKVDFRSRAKTLINIDHHPDNTFYGDINYVKPISSVAEQIYYLAKYLKINLGKEIADCLYLALITDTGNFRYELTSPATFRIAAELLERGVKQADLTTKIYDRKRLSAILIASRALSGIKLEGGGQVAWTVVTQKMMGEIGAKNEDLIGLVDEIRSLAGIEVAVLFRELKDNKVKVNFRSKERVNVSSIAAIFGGGGHLRASGALLEGNPQEAAKRVISAVLKTL